MSVELNDKTRQKLKKIKTKLYTIGKVLM